MKEINQQYLTGERALFQEKDSQILYCTFAEGESPLKESSNINIDNSMFKWKYPLWYSRNIVMKNSTLFEMARAGIWYTENISVSDSIIEAPKNFRRSKKITLNNVSFPNAEETLWNCQEITMNHVTANGHYFAMNCENMRIHNLELVGNYSFDGAKNVEIHNSRLLSRDAFWNTQNVTVYDSFISGEYLGWNAKNLTLINCTVESLQGMCYIEHLVMKNCRLLNTTQAFEYSNVDVEIMGRVESIFNPLGGTIRAEEIGEQILDETKINPDQTTIITGEVFPHAV